MPSLVTFVNCNILTSSMALFYNFCHTSNIRDDTSAPFDCINSTHDIYCSISAHQTNSCAKQSTLFCKAKAIADLLTQQKILQYWQGPEVEMHFLCCRQQFLSSFTSVDLEAIESSKRPACTFVPPVQ